MGLYCCVQKYKWNILKVFKVSLNYESFESYICIILFKQEIMFGD